MTTSSKIMMSVQTISDVNEVLAVIGEIEKVQYRTRDVIDYQQLVEKSDNSELIGYLLAQVREAGDSKALISSIKSLLKNIRLIRLVLAVRPPRSLIVRVSAWVKRNVGEDVVIEWDVDPSILGGAKVSMGGKYGDYSVEKKLNCWWENEGKILRSELGI